MPKNNSEDSLEEKLSQVHIPEPEEFIKKAAGISQVYGVLFAEDKVMKYAVLNDKNEAEKIYLIKDTDHILLALLVAKGDVFYQNAKYEVCSLFGNFKSKKRYCNAQLIIDFGGKIMDAGVDGLFETLTDKALITKDELNKNNYKDINSICSFQNRLYALLLNNKNERSFAELKKNLLDGRYEIGNEIIHYDVNNFYTCQAAILPRHPSTIDGKEYDFSVLSCAYNDYLDLNGEKIEGTEEDYHYIFRLALLSSDSERAEVVYSGDFKGINFAEIDLNKKSAKTRKLITNSRGFVSGLDVVRNKELHNKLINFGKELK